MRLGAAAVQLAMVCALAAETPPAAPEQPIAYSHKQHLALGLKCKDCHAMPEPGELMTFPAASKCMSCHQSVKKDSPQIAKLASYAAQKRTIPWARVYQIPSYVAFGHKTHLEAGATCEKCHGQVAQRERLFKETDLSMTGCMNCHLATRASLDCGFCHEPRN